MLLSYHLYVHLHIQVEWHVYRHMNRLEHNDTIDANHLQNVATHQNEKIQNHEHIF